MKWHFVDDFKDVVTGRIGTRPFPRPRGFDLVAFVVGKLVFFTWAFVVPLLFHPPGHVVLGYLVASCRRWRRSFRDGEPRPLR